VTYRDVRILDSQNRLAAVYNLTEHDLTQETNRVALKKLFLAAAKIADTDGDSLPDDWETIHFGNLSSAPGDDPDGDGYDNYTEYVMGTNPRDAASRPTLARSVSRSGQNSFLHLTMRRRAGTAPSYALEGTRDFREWAGEAALFPQKPEFRNLFDGTGIAEVSYSFPMAPESSQFFRLRVTP
jgi:hypothetical protein